MDCDRWAYNFPLLPSRFRSCVGQFVSLPLKHGGKYRHCFSHPSEKRVRQQARS
jgi:hypothetical protein